MDRLDIIGMVSEIRSLASGTIARLCGSPQYDDIDRYTAEWVQWVLSHDLSKRWRSWQTCHQSYEKCLARQSICAAQSAPGDVNGESDDERCQRLEQEADAWLFAPEE